MYTIICTAYILTLFGLGILFLLCTLKINSPAKLSIMLTIFSLFFYVLAATLEFTQVKTAEEFLIVSKIQYAALYPCSLGMLHFCSLVGRFKVPQKMWFILAAIYLVCFLAVLTTDASNNHGLFYIELTEAAGKKGTLWWITYIGFFYVIIYVTVNLIISYRKNRHTVHRKRIRYILTGIICITMEMVFKHFGFFGSYDLFVFSAFLMVVFMYLSIVRQNGYLNSIDSAPANAMNYGEEGVVMLDEYGYLLYMNNAAKKILPELSKMKKAAEHTLLRDIISGGKKTVTIGESTYEIRIDEFQEEIMSGESCVIWFVNMTEYNKKLEEINAASRAKSEFLSRMSHEMRTPINAILGFNEIIKREVRSESGLSDGELLRYCAEISASGSRLMEFVNNILNISEDEKLDKFPEYMKYFSDSANAPAQSTSENYEIPDVKILAVDDDRYNRLVIEKLLKHTKAQVDIASGGAEMLRLTEKQQYDIILLDIMMPDIDGVQALAEYRKQGGTALAAALTADAVEGSEEKYLSAGFDAYISKPVHAETLENTIKELLEREAVDTSAGIRYSDDDPEFYRRMLEIYASDAGRVIDELEKALESGDLELYRTRVHALKNNSRGIGAEHTACICFSAEKAAASENHEHIKELHEKLKSAVIRTKNNAEKILENSNGIA